jgi:hypothetical protein
VLVRWVTHGSVIWCRPTFECRSTRRSSLATCQSSRVDVHASLRT